MHKKAIVHLMTKARMKSDVFTAEIDMMEELSEKYGIKNVIYYKGEEVEYIDLISKLEKFGILLFNYSNKEELKEQSSKLNEKYEIIFVSTPWELLINSANELSQHLGLPLSEDPTIFRDKSLQRQMIQDHNPDLGVKFIKGTVDDLNIDEIEEYIGYPFIIKPTNGLQSSGVEKITSKSQFKNYVGEYEDMHARLKGRGVDGHDLIVEEFIDGKSYSIDYYVDKEGGVIISKPIKFSLGIDIGVEDYCNISRIASEKTEAEFKGKRLKTFVNSTVKATGLINTFVHHEFKITSKGELKTIELNGRIGGGRLEIIKRAYDLNMYEFIINPDAKPGVIKENNIDVNIYATKRGILKGVNGKVFQKIEDRPSVYKAKLDESFIGKEIGLTRDGFVKVGVIKLRNKNYKEIRKDYLYIKSNYKKLLIIDEEESEVSKKKRLKLVEKARKFFKI